MLDVKEDRIIHFIVFAKWIEYLWELYLNMRQRKLFKDPTAWPSQVRSDMMSSSEASKARNYGVDRCKLTILRGLTSTVIANVMVVCGGPRLLWTQAGLFTSQLGVAQDSTVSREAAVSAMFVLLLAALHFLLDLPLALYETFVIEQRHGFNKQTPGFFIKDRLKMFAVKQVILLPLVALAVTIARLGGPLYPLHVWGVSLVVTLLVYTVYPSLIAPLFDKYTPLPAGSLRNGIETMAASVGFPLYKIYIVEGSKRSSHSNAFFYGFFKNKRIVLYDTLLQDELRGDRTSSTEPDGKGCPEPEVLGVLAHELGHWYHNHIVKQIAILQTHFLVLLGIYWFLSDWDPIFRSFRFPKEHPVVIGMLIVGRYLLAPYNALCGFVMNCLTRTAEYQSDAYAASLGHAKQLTGALVKLYVDNRAYPVSDWLYSAWYHTHPTLPQRMDALQAFEHKQR